MGKNMQAASLANLNSANRKGRVGVRKRITKSLLEYLEEVVENQKPDFEQNLKRLAASDPERYVKAMLDLYKLIVPRQVQADVNVTGSEVTAIQYNFLGPGDAAALPQLQPPLQQQVKPADTFALELTDDECDGE